MRILQFGLHPFRVRVCASEHAPRDRSYLLERRHGLEEFVECGAFVTVERHRASPSHPERGLITLTKKASRRGRKLAQEFTGFSVALQMNKDLRVVVGFSEGISMFRAIELQKAKEYVPINWQGGFLANQNKPSASSHPPSSSRRTILRVRITGLDGLLRPCRCIEMCTPEV